MRTKRRVVVELERDEVKTLLDAKKIWQEISYRFDDMGCDVDYLVEILDTNLSELLDICEDGILEEVE